MDSSSAAIIKVEPYWNVNALYTQKQHCARNIKVEPYWNVNKQALNNIETVFPD